MSDETTKTEPENSTLLPVAQGDEATRLLQRLEAAGARYRTNLPLDQAWAKSWYLKTGGVPNTRLEQLKDKEFHAVAYHARVVPVLLRNTGEIVPRVMVTLFDQAGQTLAWTSEITTNKFADILAANGDKLWDPPLKLTIRGIAGKEAGHWYYFETPTLPMPKPKGK